MTRDEKYEEALGLLKKAKENLKEIDNELTDMDNNYIQRKNDKKILH